MFGKSFDQKVQDALAGMRGLDVHGLSAKVDGKVVTLTGVARDAATKAEAMRVFNSLVETENTINMLRIETPAAPRAASASDEMGPPLSAATLPPASGMQATARIHEVVKGDTLSAIAKKYYGKSSEYPKIFEANRDQLEDPDRIRPGQKLKIP